MAQSDVHSPARVAKETLAVATAEIIDMIKSIRFAFLLISYAFVAGAVGKFMLWANEKAGGRLLEGASSLTDTERTMLVDTLVEQGASKHLAEALVNGDLPPMVFGVLLFSTFAIPALMVLVGYNRVSEDVSTRYTRYLLQRVHRGSYLAGKLLGHWLVSFLAIVLVHIGLLTYAWATLGTPIVKEGGEPNVVVSWRPQNSGVMMEVGKGYEVKEVVDAINGISGVTAKDDEGAVFVTGMSEDELIKELEGVKIADWDIDSTLSAMPRIWLAMLILVLAYSAYTMMASSTLNPPIIVLLLGVMGLLAIKFAAFILGIIHEPLGEIWMGSWDVKLYALDPAAVGVYLAYTVGFLAIATLVLRRRDL